MKNLETKELSGPPLPHDEWTAEQQKLAETEAKRTNRTGGTAAPTTSEEDLDSLTVVELKERAKDAGIEGYSTMHKDDLVKALKKA